ncbi:AsnC family transcriptional regulator [Rhodobacter sphaeroides]|uniref:AsnC family transcriptional regulator n=1 Tax=Cereibacter sphaeroides TaxID=1063 RepID=UPI0009B67C54|nr:AsnC family transcriptional regulator [Cereibacter sphaeroides]AXC63858.1 AsnC family transcriptional regulator [Cereibacter sphaeroides 2.4.1]MVX50064.1 AsnC family transcriptional regulator [Cereibacter sphaeroides]MVX50083.1 AsnC family transcriptional regulator [Cereibacter sphaeroides]QHA12113.1 AsnC family transcriptional regulator [Cereibacter sphaeroides]QHA15346.1 AsnC family transcriptional regulator [Cereibacter sphaeroides]
MPTSELDRLDSAILEALQENARTPLSEVGRCVGLSGDDPPARELRARPSPIGLQRPSRR